MASLLSAAELRVDVGGVPALDGLTLETTGERVLVLGAARALFEAAAGLRRVERGRLVVNGRAPADAIRSTTVASAPLDPPMPPRWSLEQYVRWSARLAGHPRRDARERAAEALDRVALASSAASRLGASGLAMRRAAGVAAALATGSETLLIDDPLAALPDDVARPLSRVLAKALIDRRSVVFAARAPLESPLVLESDEAIVVDGAQVVAQGAPTELATATGTLALRVEGSLEAFVEGVARLGGRAVVGASGGHPAYVRVELGPSTARDVLRVAGECSAVVVELRPIARAFA